MTYSSLVTETHSTRQYSARTQPVSVIVLHHAATTDADWVIGVESSGAKEVSSHIVVKDGRRAGLVPEEFRAWSLSDPVWDSRALTVECANESTNGWTISDASHESLAQLVADWSRRYGITPHRSGTPSTWTVLGHREVNSIHGGSYATACPGGMDLDRITRRAQQLLEDDMVSYDEIGPMLQRALQFDARPKGFGATSANGPTVWERLNSIEKAILAVAQPDVDEKALASALAPLINPGDLTDAELSALANKIVDVQAARLNRG